MAKVVTKQWYESKTLWIAVAQAVAGILTVFVSENPEIDFIGIAMLVKSIIDGWVRINTNKILTIK